MVQHIFIVLFRNMYTKLLRLVIQGVVFGAEQYGNIFLNILNMNPEFKNYKYRHRLGTFREARLPNAKLIYKVIRRKKLPELIKHPVSRT